MGLEYHILTNLKPSFLGLTILLGLLLFPFTNLPQRLIRPQTIRMRMILHQVSFFLIVISFSLPTLVESLERPIDPDSLRLVQFPVFKGAWLLG